MGSSRIYNRVERKLELGDSASRRREPPGSAVAKQRRIGEANRRIVHRVEEQLIKSRRFSLPGKKALISTEKEWSAIIVDVGETPIERPKKNSEVITVEKAMQRTSAFETEYSFSKRLCWASQCDGSWDGG